MLRLTEDPMSLNTPVDRPLDGARLERCLQQGADGDLADAYCTVRRASERLCETLSPEDCTPQSMPDASPVSWHLAHTTWFFETFVLREAIPGYRPFHPAFSFLFNSYYNSVGAQYSRPHRGLITRPGLEEIHVYRHHVDDRMIDLLDGGVSAGHAAARAMKLADVVRLGLHHEQQHQELILTDVKHLLSQNPLHPVYCRREPDAAIDPGALSWQCFEGGSVAIGHASGEGFAYDNEGPRHRLRLAPFELARRPVTQGEYLAFMADGGYRRPELWLSDGWAVVQSEGWQAPLYWTEHDGAWSTYTLGGLLPLREDEPVVHLSYYEADAYANWAGARLPAEAEWEHAASVGDVAVQRRRGHFVEDGRYHPRPVVVTDDAEAEPDDDAWGGATVAHLLGNVWEWTRSAYGPYPGYRPAAGALGEYNGKFMCNQMVLRGGSCATPRSHIRTTYRNFFYPHMRWQFSGVRLARDI
jgi:ergothioneine biosynthesis protein EgtB